jgi:2-deoxy-D-gluconate 3-dehydrogenase
VTDRASLAVALAVAVAEVEGALGGIDILVNNAGIVALTGGVLNETAEIWDKTIETHLNASFLLSQLVARSMVKRKSGGKIINLASMYSIFGSGLVPSYSAAKGAIVQLTKSLAVELAPHNIQVNALAPGWIETDKTAAVRSSPMNDEIIARTPAKRWEKADEIIGATAFFRLEEPTSSRAPRCRSTEAIRFTELAKGPRSRRSYPVGGATRPKAEVRTGIAISLFDMTGAY